MRCFKCKKDKSYWDMQPMRHEDVGLEVDPKQIGRPDPKPLVCHECLGWKNKEVKS